MWKASTESDITGPLRSRPAAWRRTAACPLAVDREARLGAVIAPSLLLVAAARLQGGSWRTCHGRSLRAAFACVHAPALAAYVVARASDSLWKSCGQGEQRARERNWCIAIPEQWRGLTEESVSASSLRSVDALECEWMREPVGRSGFARSDRWARPGDLVQRIARGVPVPRDNYLLKRDDIPCCDCDRGSSEQAVETKRITQAEEIVR